MPKRPLPLLIFEPIGHGRSRARVRSVGGNWMSRPFSPRALRADCYDFLPPSFQSSSLISGLMGRHANVVVLSSLPPRIVLLDVFKPLALAVYSDPADH